MRLFLSIPVKFLMHLVQILGQSSPEAEGLEVASLHGESTWVHSCERELRLVYRAGPNVVEACMLLADPTQFHVHIQLVDEPTYDAFRTFFKDHGLVFHATGQEGPIEEWNFTRRGN